MKTLGQKIRELRGEANQGVFAKEFGYTLRQISAWERGESEPPSEFYKKCAARFGSEVLQFLLTDSNLLPSHLSAISKKVQSDYYKKLLDDVLAGAPLDKLILNLEAIVRTRVFTDEDLEYCLRAIRARLPQENDKKP